jgi:hypothetical protein
MRDSVENRRGSGHDGDQRRTIRWPTPPSRRLLTALHRSVNPALG